MRRAPSGQVRGAVAAVLRRCGPRVGDLDRRVPPAAAVLPNAGCSAVNGRAAHENPKRPLTCARPGHAKARNELLRSRSYCHAASSPRSLPFPALRVSLPLDHSRRSPASSLRHDLGRVRRVQAKPLRGSLREPGNVGHGLRDGSHEEGRKEVLTDNDDVIRAARVVVSAACWAVPGSSLPSEEQALTSMAPPPVVLASARCFLQAVIPAARVVVSACCWGWAPSRRWISGEE